ncbi:hypothetical protein BGZ49_006927 [Haplosporangium sp. Z 27]|nr:hypothetical protein BGZ49_006927 [Haplosporangium sp. Z 27]
MNHNQKEDTDELKFVKALRDIWVSNIKAVCREARSSKALAVFGSTFIKDVAQFLQLSFQGVFRLIQFDIMVIPLEKTGFWKEYGEEISIVYRKKGAISSVLAYKSYLSSHKVIPSTKAKQYLIALEKATKLYPTNNFYHPNKSPAPTPTIKVFQKEGPNQNLV